MKKITILFVLLLLLGLSSVYAQVTKPAENEKSKATSEQLDPKFSPEQQALIRVAGEDNPAKIDEASLIDPKLSPEEQAQIKTAGQDNPARVDEASLVDPKISTEKDQKEQISPVESTVKPVSAGTQPEGEKAGTSLDYRVTTTSGKEQPKGESPENALNYREIQGSADQPEGTTPDK
jgi:hypothetical protein